MLNFICIVVQKLKGTSIHPPTIDTIINFFFAIIDHFV